MSVEATSERSTRYPLVIRISKAGITALDQEAHRRWTTRSDVARQALAIGLQQMQAEKEKDWAVRW